MGTSISQRSPKTTAWNATAVAYTQKTISPDRLLTLIWRAAETQPNPLSEAIGSNTVFLCHQAVRQSASPSEALHAVTRDLISSKQNSVVSEFAKRAVVHAYVSDNPLKEWRSNFFAELTNYMVSRDASGFLGECYRNSKITDLMNFKQTIRENVKNVVNRLEGDPSDPEQWKLFVDRTLEALKGGRP